ncbi:hypothetical protein QWJ34_09710 [Saccharibacillus sp. CPCC 101409]|uniref:hypothetical protein n=1 Tax=Saccharibacillus sp. CPCC 101409 TaxID=3058041 RepID=UPI002673FBC4|nr:hypothetical protein [Saccharibacillus sp. CPCC 101409]MDO3410035.1 hypothetical protein [Saccharibacillus sp. CPCC 101409]
MRKKNVLSVMLSLLMVFTFLSSASAEVVEDPKEDLISALPDSTYANEVELDNQLKEMGFNSEEISGMPIDLKREISSKKGKKAILQKIDSIDLNQNKGNELNPDQFGITGLVPTPILSGYAVYSGTSNNGKESIYQVYATYYWDGNPEVYLTDTLAMAWKEAAVPTGTANGQHTLVDSIGSRSYSSPVQTQKVSGTAWNVDIKYAGVSGVQSGWGRQELRYLTSLRGTTTAIEVGYSHRTVPAFVTAVSLNFGYISFSGVGQFSYGNRFTFIL